MKREHAALLLRSVLSLGRRLRAERPEGSAGLSALAILGTLHRLGPIPATRLAAEERLAPQSLTRTIADLERKGWIARSLSDADRREHRIALTPDGERVLAADLRARRLWLERAMAATLSEGEREMLFAASGAMAKLAAYEPRKAGTSKPARRTTAQR